jgi:hypothetical protein
VGDRGPAILFLAKAVGRRSYRYIFLVRSSIFARYISTKSRGVIAPCDTLRNRILFLHHAAWWILGSWQEKPQFKANLLRMQVHIGLGETLGQEMNVNSSIKCMRRYRQISPLNVFCTKQEDIELETRILSRETRQQLSGSGLDNKRGMAARVLQYRYGASGS